VGGEVGGAGVGTGAGPVTAEEGLQLGQVERRGGHQVVTAAGVVPDGRLLLAAVRLSGEILQAALQQREQLHHARLQHQISAPKVGSTSELRCITLLCQTGQRSNSNN